MENIERWGVGDAASAKAFAKSKFQNGQEFELIHGDHPHSRQDNTTYARLESGAIEDFSGHVYPVKMEFEEYNYMKSSGLSGDEIRKGGEAKIFVAGVQVYSFFFRDIDKALIKAHELIPQIFDHPVQLFSESDRERWIGKKVYYREHPAIVERFILDQGCVILRSADGMFPVPCYDKDEKYTHREETVKDEIFSKSIYWWRD